jgi:hypothetical protein
LLPSDEQSAFFPNYKLVPDGFAFKNSVALLHGTFSRKTGLDVCLLLVRDRKIDSLTTCVMWRCDWENGPMWRHMRVGLALGSRDVEGGQETVLGIGAPVTLSGTYAIVRNAVVGTHSKVLPGALQPGRQQIVYVESDGPFYVHQNMSLQEFVRLNPGEHLVVMVSVL